MLTVDHIPSGMKKHALLAPRTFPPLVRIVPIVSVKKERDSFFLSRKRKLVPITNCSRQSAKIVRDTETISPIYLSA